MTELNRFAKKIVWLASYPKSGNTWFRAFLTALFKDGEVEINKMQTDGIFASRVIFEWVTDLDSRNLYEEEVKLMLPDVYRQLAARSPKTLLLKVHDAYTFNTANQPIIPADATHCAIYIIRNPLDVVASFAHHNGTSVTDTIALMNNSNGWLARHQHNLNIHAQLPQLLQSWSQHVQGWTMQTAFPVHVIRYEDMLATPEATFGSVIRKIGWQFTPAQIAQAVAGSSFDVLKNQEDQQGFKEKSWRNNSFFRTGTMGNWRHELNDNQVKAIISAHREVMQRYGYLNSDGSPAIMR